MKENCNYLEIMQVACDEICKHVGQLKQEDLEEKCKNCPLDRVLESKTLTQERRFLMLTELGKTLRQIRLDRAELLYHMAKNLDYGAAFLSGIENGKTIPEDFREKLFATYDLTDSEKEKLDSILKKEEVKEVCKNYT